MKSISIKFQVLFWINCEMQLTNDFNPLLNTYTHAESIDWILAVVKKGTVLTEKDSLKQMTELMIVFYYSQIVVNLKNNLQISWFGGRSLVNSIIYSTLDLIIYWTNHMILSWPSRYPPIKVDFAFFRILIGQHVILEHVTTWHDLYVS